MILLPAGVKVHLAFGYTDMRKGMDGLAVLVQEVLHQDPGSGLSPILEARRQPIWRNPLTENAAGEATDPVSSPSDHGV